MNKIKIQELSTPGCAHCVEAKKILENEITLDFPNVEVEYIDILSDEGQKTVQQYGIMSSPGIIVNGELFSIGGLNKEKLIKKIKSLSADRQVPDHHLAIKKPKRFVLVQLNRSARTYFIKSC